MILTVHAPAYFPEVSTCASLLAVDVVVFAETFRYHRKEGAHRAAIRTLNGPRWLSVPVLREERAGACIIELKIDGSQPWLERHRRALEYNYRNAAYYYYYADAVQGIMQESGLSLASLLRASTDFTINCLNAKAAMISSRELPALEERTERLIAWAAACGCDRCLIRPGEVALLDLPRLKRAGITLVCLEYAGTPYPQQYPGFLPGLSILDLLFNEGADAAEHIRRNSRPGEITLIH